MVRPTLLGCFCLILILGSASCAYRQPILRKLHFGEVTTFADVYPILREHCSGCHVEGGSAAIAWSLDREPVGEQYAECQTIADPNSRHQCSTYIQLTAGEFPLVENGSLSKSMPFVNACDPKNSFHIGSSIPERLDDQECKTMGNWIMQGTLRENGEQDGD